MTQIVFLPVTKITSMLITYYKILDNEKDFPLEMSINNKRKVAAFVKEWCDIAKDAFYEDTVITTVLDVT